MLRPATPLTILFFVAFVLLVVATISTPIVKGIHLASYKGVNFGVFGYCTQTRCSKIGIGYSVDPKTIYPNTDDTSDFSLPSNTRSSLSSILIVHPVAALLTLICFILSATAHLHAPSHSPRYLLAVLILSIPTLLVSLLAFLVDILLFVPHLAWGGWIVLVSTILILASGIVTCAMRRTLVSRKARKKRIAENAEMSGENFYTRQVEPTGPRAETPPPLNDHMLGQTDKLPRFATFETSKSSEDDRIPLNQRTPSSKTLPSVPSSQNPGYSENGYDRYDGSGRSGRGGMRGGNMRGPPRGYGGPPRDEYGNPLPPSNAFGPSPPAGIRRDRSEPARLRPQYSDENMRSGNLRGRGRGGYGYPPRGYGRGGPYGPGPGPGRGGYGRGPPMGPGPAPGAMMRGPPPPSYRNQYPPQGRPGQYEESGGPAGFGRSPSAPAYGSYRRPESPAGPGGFVRGPSPGPPSAPGNYQRGPSPGPPSAPGGYDRGVSPAPPPTGAYGYAGRLPTPTQYQQNCRGIDPGPPEPTPYRAKDNVIGQAVEMDALNGCPSPTPASAHDQMQLRESDSDVQGFVNLQQQTAHRETPTTLTSTSLYSGQDAYVPPRANWMGNANARGAAPPSKMAVLDRNDSDPVELPTQNTLRKNQSRSGPGGSGHARKASDNYYEDVDPRFANDSDEVPETALPTPRTIQTQSSQAMPSSLMPGPSSNIPNLPPPRPQHLEIQDSYEDIADGQRSPASDHSNMTSISQRGVNPNWRPGSTDGHVRADNNPLRQVHEQRGALLDSNPDFEVPVRGDAGSRLAHLHPTQMGQAF